MTDRERKLDKLKKLLNLASNNTNKAEAMAAIDILQARAAEYGLTLDDVKSYAHKDHTQGFGEKSAYSGERQYGFVDQYLWKAIARFCCCKVNVGTDEDGDLTIRFFGHEVDVELAFWLRGTIKAAMAFEWGIYRDFVMGGGNVSVAMRSFHVEFANEVRERMQAVERATPPTGTELVVLKSQLVEQKAVEAGFKEPSGSYRAFGEYDAAAGRAGRQAGARVDLGRGVAGRTSTSRMIGKS